LECARGKHGLQWLIVTCTTQVELGGVSVSDSDGSDGCCAVQVVHVSSLRHVEHCPI